MKHTAPTLLLDVRTPCTSGAYDPDAWYGETREDVEEAKAACARCPQRSACLQAALDRHEPAGIWGGERFRKGRPYVATPTARRAVPIADPAGSAEHEPGHPDSDASLELAATDAEPERRRKADVDPERVTRAVELVRAGLLGAGDGLTVAERRAVIAETYPAVPRSVVAEVLGIAERTVDRAVAELAGAREAA